MQSKGRGKRGWKGEGSLNEKTSCWYLWGCWETVLLKEGKGKRACVREKKGERLHRSDGEGG